MKNHKYVIEGICIALGILVILCVAYLCITTRAYTVYGESMEPSVHNGDIAVISICSINQISDGDIIAFRDSKSKIIIHRVVGSTLDVTGRRYVYTKGDNNEDIDLTAVSGDALIGKCTIRISNKDNKIEYMEQ